MINLICLYNQSIMQNATCWLGQNIYNIYKQDITIFRQSIHINCITGKTIEHIQAE